jgi:hypothetical protein
MHKFRDQLNKFTFSRRISLQGVSCLLYILSYLYGNCSAHVHRRNLPNNPGKGGGAESTVGKGNFTQELSQKEGEECLIHVYIHLFFPHSQ